MKFIFILFFLTSCASYVNSMHRKIDREEARNSGRSLNDPYSAYREQGFKRKGVDKRAIQNPNSISNMNPTNNNEVTPPVKRDYRSTGQRSSARDFQDNGSSGSLWVNAPGGSLFTTEITKRVGDIVIINVLESLRGQISGELKRAFPDSAPKKTAAKAGAKGAAPAPAPEPAPADKGDELDTKVYDKISGVVAEEINKDFFLLRGKKEVVFRKEKRFIEVQALVARKDITDNDSINSDLLVESRVIILR
ncbi:MAG: flagellar basal body L-ring protein FlgH [Bacteriovoracaceae bacterium]|nr:flagellar basal body L-ring protein FlgH [Bacteriovoracaceae bacterium]